MLVFIIIGSVWQIYGVSGACPGGCGERTLVYDDLRCKSIYEKDTDCCPSHFDCSHIEQDAKIKDKCHFHGKLYSLGEAVNNDEIYGKCRVGCTCQRDFFGGVTFGCASLDCPEWLGHHPPPTCYPTYELDKCCRTGHLCPPVNHTCHVNERTYNLGEKYAHPYIKCNNCVCKEGLAFGECKQEKCIEEIANREEIERFCAPSYRKDDHCCPWSWICPELKDEIVAAKTPSKYPDLKCKFGEKTLNIGDSFDRKDEKYGGTVNCECNIPPLLTCIHTFPPTPTSRPLIITKIEN